jgi:hypothetical protein
VKLTGSFAQLAKLREGLARLEQQGVEAVAEAGAKSLRKVVEAEYRQGKGPDGERWAPLASGDASHLTDTREMRDTTTVVHGVSGITTRIAGKRNQAVYHQYGTKKMPARPLVPKTDEPLPKSWAEPLQQAGTKALKALLRKQP